MAARGVGIDRLSADDLMALAGDHGTVPMQVGGVLWFGADAPGVDGLTRHLSERLPAAPRLRQVFGPLPFGCGRPVWVDDPCFVLGEHLQAVEVSGSDQVDRVALDLLAARLPRDRPLWAARIVTGPDGAVLALVLVVHHVLADGLAALALLAMLADGPEPAARPFPAPAPTRRELARDNLRGRLAGLRHLPGVVVQLGMALRLLAAGGRAPHTALNRPTGTRRVLGTVSAGLEDVRRAAHSHGGTVNDAVLAAATGALGTLLGRRGEHPQELVVSVPFGYRSPGQITGNASAVMPLRLPVRGDLGLRIGAVAQVTRAAKLRPRAMSNTVLRPVFGLLVRLGLFRRFLDSQKLVNTLVTNVRGPAEPLLFGGHPVHGLVPLTSPTGNMTVVIAVLSYAGNLTITAIADADLMPDLPVLLEALGTELDQLVRDC